MRGTEEKDQGTFASKSGNSTQIRKQTGITMIALIITIIVMIVLASVSINAIVGDNGIITQAQNATIQNSIANLEEYLQELYVENYDTIASGNYSTKLEGLSNLENYKKYFYSPYTVHGVSNLNYIVTSDGYVLYLIYKSELPDEIKDQLIGGDAGDGTYSDYAILNDVYGVTSDLKVYYCSDGIGTITGLTVADLDVDNPERSVTISDGNLASILESLSYITRNDDGTFSAQELRSITELTITISNVSLTELYNLSNLQKIYFENVTLTTLSGIENCPKLYYVYNKGSSLSNYTAVGKLGSQLKYLYFYNITDSELETACSKTVGIGSYDLENLKYFAVVGNTNYISSLNVSDLSNLSKIEYSSKSSSVYSISCLDNLTSTTKQAITYLSLQNNYLNSLNGISNFTNVYLLRCEYNLLENLDEISSMSNLEYLICGYNTDLVINSKLVNTNLYLIYCDYCTTITSLYFLEDCSIITYIYASYCSIGANETSTKDTESDSLVALQGKSGLTYLGLTYNTSLIWIDYIKDLANVDHCYLEGDTNIDSDSLLEIKYVILGDDDHVGCGYNYSLPSASYSFLLLDDDTTYLDLSSQTVELSNFELLKDLTSLEKLSIANMTLQDEGENLSDEDVNTAVNDVLITLTGMKYLTLDGMSAVTSLDFVENMTNIVQLILTGTSITDLTILEDLCIDGGLNKLVDLAIDNEDIDLTKIQTAISKISQIATRFENGWEGENYFGVRILNEDLLRNLGSCTLITDLCISPVKMDLSGGVIDLSGCSSLEAIYIGYFTNTVFVLPQTCTSFKGNAFYSTYVDLSYAENLESLLLYYQRCSADLWNLMFSTSGKCIALERFEYSFYDMTGPEDFSALAYLPEDNIISSFSVYHVAAKHNLTNLTSLSGIENLSNLEELSIRYSYISSLTYLGNLSNLTTLTLNNNSITSIEGITSTLSNVTTLDLSYNNLSSLYGIQYFTGLQTLDISYNTTLGDTASYNGRR